MTAPQICTIAEILPLTVKLLGVQDANYPSGAKAADGAPYNTEMVKKLVFQTDYEIALMIAASLENPLRTIFNVEETAFLTDGGRIPASAVNHSRVTLKYNNQVRLGQQREYQRLKRIKDNPGVYGSPKYIYAIFAGNIHFANASVTGKLEFPVIVKDTTLTTLLSPLAYFWAVVAGAITKAAMPGFPDSHRKYWAEQWLLYAREIKSGAVALPEPEQLERLGT